MQAEAEPIEVPDYAITADDLRAIKEANYVVIFWRPDMSEGVLSGMRFGLDVDLERDDGAERKLARIARGGLWTRTWASEYRISYVRVIPAGMPAQIELYNSGGIPGGQATEAVWLATSLRFHRSVQSVLRLLKVGDQIGAYFIGSNNNENLNSVNHHRDECYLRIKRKDKLIGEFLLGVEVGPNNTARMVKPG